MHRKEAYNIRWIISCCSTIFSKKWLIVYISLKKP